MKNEKITLYLKIIAQKFAGDENNTYLCTR